MQKYRFDDAYQKVYEYDQNQKAYVFLGSYFAFGIDAKMSEVEKIQAVEEGLIEE